MSFTAAVVAANMESMSAGLLWLQRTNLWRERTNLRTGLERLRGVIRRLDPEALAFFGLGHPWWRHPRIRMLRSSPEQSLALHRCLLEEDTDEETATRQRCLCDPCTALVPEASVCRRRCTRLFCPSEMR